MKIVRACAAAACLASLAAPVLATATPASADPVIITAPDYAPRGRAREINRYYDDGRVIRREVRPSYGRGGYVEEMYQDDPVYETRPRRIPSSRERRVRADGYYDDRYARGYRRYYDDSGYEPYETREPEVEDMPRRLAGPPSAAGGQAARRTVDPKFARTVVPYNGPEAAGSIVINTRTRYLYLVQSGGQAIRYGVGVGKEGFTWKGVQSISNKREWPNWHPPAEMRARRPELPVMMAGGPDNPLGARALYLGDTLYRIHGSNEPWTIGQAVSSGCIRMTNDDVIDLYDRVGVGTSVKVL